MTETIIWRVCADLFRGMFGMRYPASIELKEKARELIGLRIQFEKLVADNPEEADALEIIFENIRKEIIEREPPEKPQRLGPGV